MLFPKTDFKDLSFNISNYCISSCRYCGLGNPQTWNLDQEMNLKQIGAFLTDPILNHLTTIHLTGGEPFLSPKFLSIIDILYEHHRNVPINLPTNALYPQLITRLMERVVRKFPNLRVNIGLEGPDKSVHELIRGLGSWEPVWDTVRALKMLDVPMTMNMSLFKENYHYIRETKRLCDQWGVGFYLNFGRYSIRFGNVKDAVMWYGDKEQVIVEIQQQIDDIGWLKEREFNRRKWAIQTAFWRGQKVHWNCLAGIEGVDIFPNGDVYPCLMYLEDYRFGNVASREPPYPLSKIMETSHSKEIQQKIYQGDCSETCPFTCQLRLENLTIEGEKVKF